MPETPQRTSTKRPLPVEDADGVIDLAPTPKKPKATVASNGGPTSGKKRKFEDGASPSKRRRLEEDGVVVMDGPNEVLDSGEVGAAPDSDIILIDDD
jgi:ubiquitin-like 1-activating enzyme E1 B